MTALVEPQWLDQKAAAAHLSVSTRTVRNWVAAGVLAVHHLPGGLRRYRLDELDALATPVVKEAG